MEADRIEEARKVFDVTSAGTRLIRDLTEKRGLDCEWEPVESLLGAVPPRHEARLERDQRMYAALGLETTWLPENELRRRVACLQGESPAPADHERGARIIQLADRVKTAARSMPLRQLPDRGVPIEASAGVSQLS